MDGKLPQIRLVAFDADDTLWDNEVLFRDAEEAWAESLSAYGSLQELSDRLYEVEEANMEDLGYGAKAFAISLMETTLKVAGENTTAAHIRTALEQVRRIIRNPATPLPGVRQTLEALRSSGRYRMAMLTKGDLLDQERKLARSGLGEFFDRVEIVSGKGEAQYMELCRKEGIAPEQLAMVGNSFKSDIAPVLRLGGTGFHVPSKTIWVHEVIEEFSHPNLRRLEKFSDLLPLLLP